MLSLFSLGRLTFTLNVSFINFLPFSMNSNSNRCIKPNENSFSNQFVSNVVHKQIRDSGMVEFSRVRKFNYSIKFEFANLLNRFKQA